ncbi:Redox-sensitive transcriptional activator SoxR [Rhodovulum sp. PH10]|uniref:redox-sensitive transcriptional activator SoxR n=1 Tax=Rhodovulum sp. PH10 TaxID=1187851 RepID=UPI00027C2BBD|nr:redox-sensitive transcriptional activator SoxR [Rhodovulum sp. PH10]EJW10017.1 Redox-sensitive transcriptional activator SoxR [Rhodovulum sp. PH10]
MSGPEKGLTVGEVARRTGVPVSTLHFYEAKGLISGWRTEGNQRRYARAVLRRIAVVRIAQRAGIPLAAVKAHLDEIPDYRAVSLAEWRRLNASWQAMLDERIAGLLQLRNELERCIGCGCLSFAECALRNPDDVLADEGPGPRLLAVSPAANAPAPTSHDPGSPAPASPEPAPPASVAEPASQRKTARSGPGRPPRPPET